MGIKDIHAFEVHAVELQEAIDECNHIVQGFGLASEDVISMNVLPPDPRAVAEGVARGAPPRVRVVMMYWRYVPLG